MPSFLASRSRVMPRGFGRPLKRQEDPRLITGAGLFSDDVSLPGQVHACFVRSPHPHASIRTIDAAAALAMPGVLAVLTGRDAAADGLADLPHRPVPTNPNEYPLGSRERAPIFVAPFPALPVDRARFAGEAVAMVVAETAALAADAASLVAVDWEPLAAVTATRDAGAAGRPGAVGRPRRQRLRRLAGRRRAGRRRRLRRRDPRGAPRHLGAAHHRRADGAACGAGRPRPRHRPPHPLRGLRRLGPAQDRRGRGAGRPGSRGPGDRPGRGRQLRHAQLRPIRSTRW